MLRFSRKLDILKVQKFALAMLLLNTLPIIGGYSKIFSIILFSVYFLYLMSVTQLKVQMTLPIKLFLISYAFTIITSSKNNIVSTVSYYIWTLIYLVIIIPDYEHKSKEVETKNFYSLNRFITILTGVSVLAGLLIYVLRISLTINGIFYGYWNNRNTGFHMDSILFAYVIYLNFSAALINITLSKNLKKRNWLYVFFAVLDLIVMCTTGSRNEIYPLIFLGVVYIILSLNKTYKKIIVTSAFAAVIGLVGMFGIYKGAKIILPKIEISNPISNKTAEPVIMAVASDAFAVLPENVSNGNLERYDYKQSTMKYNLSGRYEIWISGLQTLRKSVLFGFSTGSMADTIYYDPVNEKYHLHFSKNTFGAMHNGWLQALLASGVVGFTLILSIVISELSDGFKYLKCVKKKKNNNYYSCVKDIGIILVIHYFLLQIGQCVTFFDISILSVYFFICLHYLRILSRGEDPTVKEI